MKALPALVLLLLLLSPGPVAPGKRGQRGPKPAASAALELDPGDGAASGSGQQPQAAANATCEAVMLTGQQYFKFYDRQRLEEARAAGKRLLIHWVANVDGGGRFIRDSLLGSLQAYMDLVVECFGDDPAKPFHYYVIQLEEFKGHVGHLKAAMEAAKPNDDQQKRLDSVKLEKGWKGFLAQPRWLRDEGSAYAHWWGVATVISPNLLSPVQYVRAIVVPTFGTIPDERPDVVFFGDSEQHLPAISWDLPPWALAAAEAGIQSLAEETRAALIADGVSERLADVTVAGTASLLREELTRPLTDGERVHASSARIVSVVVDDAAAGGAVPPTSSALNSSAGASCAAPDPLTTVHGHMSTHAAAGGAVPPTSSALNSSAGASCAAPDPLTTVHGHMSTPAALVPPVAFDDGPSPTAIWLTALYGPVRRSSEHEHLSEFVQKMENRELMWQLTGTRFLAPLKDIRARISLGGDFNLEIVSAAERGAASRDSSFHQAGTAEGFWDAATSTHGFWINLVEEECTRIGISSESRLDYVLITKPLKMRNVTGGAVRMMKLASDHCPVFAAYFFPAPSSAASK